MKTVKDLLGGKGHEVWSTTPEATVFSALELMAEKNVGALLVLDGEALVGILSERDYARKVILLGKSSRETLVSEIMTTRVLCVRPGQDVNECLALMSAKRIRHLPVLDDTEKVVGVISIGDVGKAIIAEQEFTISLLEHYITGSTTESSHV